KRLGLTVHPLTPDMARRFCTADTEGLIVSAIWPDSPASNSGVLRGDIIKEIDRRPVTSVKDFLKALSAVEKKDSILFLIIRGNNTIYVVVRLKEQP
ncbi:MAG: PDZ domain-containing protein, partial [Deltaproteobacteria bacterium]